MQILRDEIVGLLNTLGFANADKWGPDKIAARAAQIPGKVKSDDIEEEFQILYGRLAKLKKGQRLQVVSKIDPNGSGDEPELRLIDTATPADETPRKKETKEQIRIRELEARLKMMESKLSSDTPGAEFEEEEEERVYGFRDKTSKSKSELEIEEGVKTGRVKVVKSKPEPRERKLSVADRVNAALKKKWKTTEQIVEETGLTPTQVRNPLYALNKSGKVEHRKLIQWKLADGDVCLSHPGEEVGGAADDVVE